MVQICHETYKSDMLEDYWKSELRVYILWGICMEISILLMLPILADNPKLLKRALMLTSSLLSKYYLNHVLKKLFVDIWCAVTSVLNMNIF